MPRADDASGFLDHLEDDAAVDVAHNVGVVWPHDSAGKREKVTMTGSGGRITTSVISMFLQVFLASCWKINTINQQI